MTASASRHRLTRVGLAAFVTLTALVAPHVAAAQTDFYNTDRGRPLQIEDAYPTERYAFELQLAPLRLERAQGGTYNWGVEPEIAYGVLPRTQLEIGVPLAYVDRRGSAQRTFGGAGVEVSLLHNLNVETETLPALAVVADVVFPAGGLGPDRTYPSVKAIATRTYSWLRFHANAQYTFNDRAKDRAVAAQGDNAGVVELSRWMTGIAVDKTLPLRSMLIGAETFARQPIMPGTPVEWNAGAGIRYQLSPAFAIDGGAGARLTGDDRSWYVTFGTAYAFGIRSLFPVRGGR